MTKKIEYPESAINDLVDAHGTGVVAKHFGVSTNSIRNWLTRAKCNLTMLQDKGTIKNSPVTIDHLLSDFNHSKFKPKNKWPKDITGIKEHRK